MAETETEVEVAGDERATLLQRLDGLANVCIMIVNREHTSTSTFQELAERGNTEAKESLARYEEYNQDLREAIGEVGFTEDERAVLLAQNRTRHLAVATFKVTQAGAPDIQSSQSPYDSLPTGFLRQLVAKVEKVKEVLDQKYENSGL